MNPSANSEANSAENRRVLIFLVGWLGVIHPLFSLCTPAASAETSHTSLPKVAPSSPGAAHSDSSSDSKAIRIVAGSSHTCAVLETGQMVCWGEGAKGKLGNGQETQDSISAQKVNTLQGVTAIAAGNDHTCAVANHGAIYCWGDAFFGKLGKKANAPIAEPTLVPGITGANVGAKERTGS